MKITQAIVLILAVAIDPAICLAYVDPNAGGWLFQWLFPVFVALGGAWVVFKSYLLQSIHKFWRHKKEEDND